MGKKKHVPLRKFPPLTQIFPRLWRRACHRSIFLWIQFGPAPGTPAFCRVFEKNHRSVNFSDRTGSFPGGPHWMVQAAAVGLLQHGTECDPSVCSCLLLERLQQTRHRFREYRSNAGEQVFGKEGGACGKTMLRPSSLTASIKRPLTISAEPPAPWAMPR